MKRKMYKNGAVLRKEQNKKDEEWMGKEGR
jgi:hypothetical protein